MENENPLIELQNTLLPTDISLFHYVQIAVAGAILFVLFYLLKRTSILSWLPRNVSQFVKSYLSLAEVVIWGLYTLYVLYILLLPNPILGLGTLIVAGLLVWPLLRNFVSGLWIKATNRHSVGQIITVGDFTGTISKLSNTSLHIENDKGETLLIAYSNFLKQTVIQESPSDLLKSYPVELFVKKKRNENRLDIQRKIVMNIMALPYAVGTKLPYVEAINESLDSIHFRIVLYGIDHGHLHRIENQLHAQFARD